MNPPNRGVGATIMEGSGCDFFFLEFETMHKCGKFGWHPLKCADSSEFSSLHMRVKIHKNIYEQNKLHAN